MLEVRVRIPLREKCFHVLRIFVSGVGKYKKLIFVYFLLSYDVYNKVFSIIFYFTYAQGRIYIKAFWAAAPGKMDKIEN